MTRGTVMTMVAVASAAVGVACATDPAADVGGRVAAGVLFGGVAVMLARRARHHGLPTAAVERDWEGFARDVLAEPEPEPEPETEQAPDVAPVPLAPVVPLRTVLEPVDQADADEWRQSVADVSRRHRMPEPESEPVRIVLADDGEPEAKPRKVSAHHAAVMADFYAARQAWDDSCEVYSKGHATEAAEFAELWPRPRLADFMRDHAARAAEPEPELEPV